MALSKLKYNLNSLFIKLFSSFLVIILILTGFSIFSFKHYYDTMIDNMIDGSSEAFRVNTSKYDEYFTDLYDNVNSLNFEINMYKLVSSEEPYPYEMVDAFNALRKSLPFVDTIFLVIQGKDFVITHEGSYNSDFFLENKTTNHDQSFWLSLVSEPFNILYLKSEITGSAPASSRRLLPVVFKPSFVNSEFHSVKYYFCTLIDIEGLYKSINMGSDPFFCILDGNGLLYSTDNTLVSDINDYKKGETVIKNKSTYVLYSDSELYDLVYAKIYPLNELNSVALRLCIVLLYVFIVVLLIATAISVFFTIRFRNPIAKIAETIASRSGNPDSTVNINTSISEVRLITSRLNSILVENKRIVKDLSDKNSLLKSYFIQDKIKNISNIKETKDQNINFSNYAVVLYKIFFKPDFYEKFNHDSEKALNFIKHLIEITVSDVYPGSITFQMESEQFISIIDLGEKNTSAISDTLRNIHILTSNDIQYFSIIIAVSNIYQDASCLNTAYNEALKIMKHRKLNDENQILTVENVSAIKLNIYLPVEQEKRITEAMANGDKQSLTELIDHILNENLKKSDDAYSIGRLSIEIVNNFMKILNDLKINIKDIINMDEIYEDFEDFCTIDQHKDLLHQLIIQFTDYIGEKRKNNDYISSFVLDYIHNNYMEDIYLDLIATKLNISPNYLSTLFKDKTGVNFIDYINSIRVDKAKELLVTGTKKVIEIASVTGFKSIQSFIRTFKRYTSKTPNEYRKDYYLSQEI